LNLNSWLKTNTFHHKDFWDLNQLVKEKEKQSLSVSLCIPTLNEERTIGKEVVIFKSELMQRYPLLDEIAVIDSGSSDDTREVAASFGADVYLSAEILKSMGEKKGKGENLWKAIYQLKGDIIVYIDADIKNIHPRFVYGLLAPLIYRPKINYVKAFYDRPLASSQGIRPSGGGRVTEYAVRREVLEKIPFPIGYGVETSHLIDVYHQWGMNAFGQTDLDRRVHRNQPTRDLGKMAFGILQTFNARVESLGLVKDLPKLNNTLRQFQARNNVFEEVEYEILEEERPPMIEIPLYREKFGLT